MFLHSLYFYIHFLRLWKITAIVSVFLKGTFFMNEYKWKNYIARFLSAQTISLLGSSIVQYAIIWYITLTTSSGKIITLSTLCGFLPQILISFFAGVWIDRYSRKRIVMITDCLIASATLILALFFLTGHKNIELLLAVLAIRSAGTGVQTPAVNAIIPQIVPQRYLMKVNGINSTISSIIVFVSPAISGAVLSIATLEATLFIDILTALVGITITATVPIQPLNKEFKIAESQFAEMKEGIVYLKNHPFVRKMLVFQLLILFLISPSAFLTPLMVSRTFGTEVWRLTMSEMTYSFGMIIGGAIITSWGGFKKKLNTTLVAGGFYGMLMIGLGMAPAFIFYLICNMLIGITSPCYNSPITVSIQENVEPKMQGRIFSFMQITNSCALPLGMIFFGPLADITNIQFLLVVSGIIVFIICTFAYLRKLL